MSPPPDLVIRVAIAADLGRLEEIRAAAFAPIFASFRAILGDEIYAAAQAHEDAGQADILRSLFAPDSNWEAFVAEHDGIIAGFVSLRCDRDRSVGEIGLNAVDPNKAGAGIGTAMYRFAIDRMKEAGMRVATVSTGGDPGHGAARRAYEKAGFDIVVPSVWMTMRLDKP